MNREPSINHRRLITILVVLMLISGAVFVWLRDIVREVVVIPVSYLLFVAGIVVDTAPQLFFWLVVILIAFWIAYRSMSTRRRAAPTMNVPILRDMGDKAPYGGRVAFWSTKVNHMRRYRSVYYQSTFHVSLARLLIELLAYRYRLTMLETEERLRGDLLDVPEEVRAYVLSSLSRREITHQKFFRRLWRMILETVQRWMPGRSETSVNLADNQPESPAEAQLVRIIHYMEEELEVPHDHPSQ